MTPELKKSMKGEPLEDGDLKKVSGGIRFHDMMGGVRGEEDDTDVPTASEPEENNNDDGGRKPPVFVKPVYDPDEI